MQRPLRPRGPRGEGEGVPEWGGGVRGEIASLKRFADDVREVQAGRECGIRVRDWNSVQPGDVLEIYTVEEVPA